MTQVLVLAAGEGRRLYPFTEITPKIMFPVGKEQKPMAHKIIEHCGKHGLVDFIFLLNEETGKQVVNYLGDGSRFGVNISYSFSKHPLGTAGEVWNAKHLITSKDFFLYYGDTLCNTNLRTLMNIHNIKLADVTVVGNTNISLPVGLLNYTEDGFLANIREKPAISVLNDWMTRKAGILPIYYVTNKDFVHNCIAYQDIAINVIPALMKGNHIIRVFEDKEPFLDIGSWKNFESAREWEE